MGMTCGVMEDTMITAVKCQTLACQPKEVSMKKIFTRFFKHIGLICYFFDIFTFYGFLGPLDNNGYECPVSCPMNCPMKDMMKCPGGDDGNGCEMPEYCISSYGKFESHFSFCMYLHALKITKC